MDALMPGATKAPAPGAAEGEATKAYKSRLSAHVPPAMLDEVRDCVVFMASKRYGYSIAGLVQDAIRAELDRLRKKENGGKPWPKRQGPVATGRPIRS